MGGIASPKRIVCGFTTPPQAGHAGTATPSSSHAWTSSRLNAAPHARHRARVAMPPAMRLLKRGPRGRLGTWVAASGGTRLRAARLGSSRGARLRLALRIVSGADVRVVAAPDVTAHRRAGLDLADPRVEIARQLRIAVVAIRGERAQRRRVFPRLEDEDTLAIRGVEGRRRGEGEHDVAPGQLGHSILLAARGRKNAAVGYRRRPRRGKVRRSSSSCRAARPDAATRRRARTE